MKKNFVAIVMGSDSDMPVMEKAAQMLKTFDVNYVITPASAHRSPNYLKRLMAEWEEAGVQVYIAGAGAAAHLAGVLASHTEKPVIGVPLGSKLSGFDSLLSTVQMPKGVPVATVAIENADNAAILAVQIMALSDPALRKRLVEYKRKLEEGIMEKSKEILARAA